MRDDEMAALRRIFEGVIEDLNDSDRPPSGMRMAAAVEQYVPGMLDELERLREIARAAASANGPLVQDSEFLHWTCGLCGETADWKPSSEDAGRSAFVHAPDCPVTKARELLGTAGCL